MKEDKIFKRSSKDPTEPEKIFRRMLTQFRIIIVLLFQFKNLLW